MKNDIICFALDFWSEIWHRCHHLMYRFAKDRRVLVVSQPVSIWQIFNLPLYKSKAGHDVLKTIFQPIARPLANLTIIYPRRIFPGRFEKIELFRKINIYFHIMQIKKIVGENGIKNPIFWAQCVEAAQYIGKFSEKMLVYDLTEDWLELFSPSRKEYLKEVAKNDKILMENADLVFAISEYLFQKRSKIHPETYLVQNGSDFEHFNTVDQAETKIDTSIADLRSPVVGYVGWLSDRVDFTLLEKIAIEKPEWNIILAGPVQDKKLISRLQEINNVWLIGPVPYKKLPTIIKKFDVCIIPHILNNLTASMNPLKLLEYLASGKPIVTTRVSGVSQFEDVIHIAESHDDFIAKLEIVLAKDSAVDKQKRLEKAKLNTWDKLTMDMDTILNNIKRKID